MMVYGRTWYFFATSNRKKNNQTHCLSFSMFLSFLSIYQIKHECLRFFMGQWKRKTMKILPLWFDSVVRIYSLQKSFSKIVFSVFCFVFSHANNSYFFHSINLITFFSLRYSSVYCALADVDFNVVFGSWNQFHY